MSQVKDYRIIEAVDPENLEEEVRKHLANGWTLQGGVNVIRFLHKEKVFYLYSQAVVINKVNDPESMKQSLKRTAKF